MDVFAQQLARAYWDANALLLRIVDTAVAAIVENVRHYLEIHHLTPGSLEYRRLDRQGDDAVLQARQVLSQYSSSSGDLPPELGTLAGDLGNARFWADASSAISRWIGVELAKLDAAALAAEDDLQSAEAHTSVQR